MLSISEKITNLLQQAIEQLQIPGAVIAVSHRGKAVFEQSIGSRMLQPTDAPMQMNTVFDAASLTKVIATLPAVLTLVDRKAIALTDKVSRYIPAFGSNGKEDIEIQHLLTHTSGLPAERKFYLDHLTKTEMIDAILSETALHPPGDKVIYSDLGFMMLSALVEECSGMEFQDFVREHVTAPLQMEETAFRPTFDASRYASTEFSKQLGVYKHGVVHDGNAFAMGGVSGHAGLFTTMQDLRNYASFVESGGCFNGKQIISEELWLLARQNFSPRDLVHRGLGWLLNSSTPQPCSDLFSPRAYGHTGFTGTSLWFDPDNEIHVTLLTNRVHIGRKEVIHQLRYRLHNLVYEELALSR